MTLSVCFIYGWLKIINHNWTLFVRPSYVYVLEKSFVIIVHKFDFECMNIWFTIIYSYDFEFEYMIQDHIFKIKIFSHFLLFAKFWNKYLTYDNWYELGNVKYYHTKISESLMKKWVQQKVKCIWLKQGVTFSIAAAVFTFHKLKYSKLNDVLRSWAY